MFSPARQASCGMEPSGLSVSRRRPAPHPFRIFRPFPKPDCRTTRHTRGMRSSDPLACRVAVGTEVTSRPPRRSRRAAFPHRAPTGLLSKVKRNRRSGLGQPIQFQSVGSGRRGHAVSGAVSGACVGRCPSFDRPPSLHALRHHPVGWRCSRLHRYSAAVRLLLSSEPARSFELPDPARDRLGGCGRQETSQVPTRSLTARTDLRLRRSDGPSQNGPAHVACGGSQRLGLRDFDVFEAQYSPRRLAVYASRPPSPTTPQHSLPGGRYSLPGPDFHRLDRASFAWRTRTSSKARQKR
jgi:hypothetical protein